MAIGSCVSMRMSIIGTGKVAGAAVVTVGPARWCPPIIPSLRRLRQEGSEFEASLGCIVRLLPRKNKTKDKTKQKWVLGTTSIKVLGTERGQGGCHRLQSGCLGTSAECCKGQGGEGLGGDR